MTSETPLQQMLRALVRFWWVAIVGILLAGLVFVFATYKVTLGVPPKLEARSAVDLLRVDAAADHEQARPVPLGRERQQQGHRLGPDDDDDRRPTRRRASTRRRPTATTTRGADGDLQRLVEIANSLPPRVTSDPVIKLRNKDVPRASTAASRPSTPTPSRAPAASAPARSRTSRSRAPRSRRRTHSTSPTTTALAFKKWFEARQVASQARRSTTACSSSRSTAPTAPSRRAARSRCSASRAALLVLLGAAGFALALERLIPRRSRLARSAPSRRPPPVARSRSPRSASPRCRRSRCRR